MPNLHGVKPETIYLASRSPRRRELLAAAGYVFEIRPASDDAEDAIRPSESPIDYVKRLASQKAAEIAARIPEGLVIGCDTLVVCKGEILGKPSSAIDARRMHHLLRGQRHEVISGLCVISQPQGTAIIDYDVTVLLMKHRSDAEIDDYIAGGEWEGKAGGFGLQDGIDWVEIVEGSPSNVVGMPMELLATVIGKIKNARTPNCAKRVPEAAYRT